jgi:tetratricopeptide (TPR) repeat protein
MAFTLFIFLLLAPNAENDQVTYLFAQGNDAFQQGDYQKAIEHYTAAISLGYESAPLYYNLGNAYFKTNQIGKCILFYERAHKLAPRDSDILFNLQLSQLYVVDKIEKPPPFFLSNWWKTFSGLVSIPQHAHITLFAYVLLMLLLIIRILSKKRVLLSLARALFIPAIIFFIISAVLFVLSLDRDIKIKEGVIMVQKVDVKSSPADDATDVFALHEGLKVRITAESGEYVRIVLPDGKVGWVNSKTIEMI